MPSEITVMSYNVRYDNPNDGEYVWGNRRDEVASVVRFHRPDLVGLQEASHGQLRDLRDRLPRFEWLKAGREDADNAGEHPAIGYDKSRFNLEGERSFWLSETPDEPGSVGWDAALPRMVKSVRLREYETDVEFSHFNTHFDHAGETARAESARLLRDRVDEVEPTIPVVVTGDLNCRESSDPYRCLTERERSGAARTLLDAHYATRQRHHGPSTTMTDFRNLVPDKKIDYVLVSSEIEVLSHGVCSDSFGNGRYVSDHLPVRAELSLPVR
jgi:endonuclease/exonuclease/phosphatase family metal-dependent hydrolase